MSTCFVVIPLLSRIPQQLVLLVLTWLALASLSRLPMPRCNLAVVTGILAPCCYAVAYATGFFVLLMSSLANQHAVVVTGSSRRRLGDSESLRVVVGLV